MGQSGRTLTHELPMKVPARPAHLTVVPAPQAVTSAAGSPRRATGPQSASADGRAFPPEMRASMERALGADLGGSAATATPERRLTLVSPVGPEESPSTAVEAVGDTASSMEESTEASPAAEAAEPGTTEETPEAAKAPAEGEGAAEPASTPEATAGAAEAGAAPEVPATAELLMPEPPAGLSADDQERIAGVQQRATAAASTHAAHPSATATTAAAQAAVTEPPAETKAKAQEGLIAEVDRQEPPKPDIEALCQQIFAVIRSKRPPDEESLVKADPEAMGEEAGKDLNQSVEGDAKRVQGGYDAIDAQPTGSPDSQPTPVEPAPATVEAPPIGAEAAVPDAVPAENVSLDADVAANQARLDQAGMNSETAKLVQDGPVAEARAAQGELQTIAERDPAEVMAELGAKREQAGADMAALQQRAVEALASTRTGTVSTVTKRQGGMVETEEQMRTRVGTEAQAIFASAQTRVDEQLKPLATTAMDNWKAGIDEASTRFDQSLKKVEDWIKERHSGGWGTLVSAWDYVAGLPDWVTEEYDKAELKFGTEVCDLIRKISRDVDVVIVACEAIITESRSQIEKLYADLPVGLQAWAAGERERFGKQLDGLHEQTAAARDEINTGLIERAGQAVQDARQRIHELREAAKGALGRALDAIAAFIDDPVKAIIEGLLKLVGIPPASFWALVAKIQDVIGEIADDPVGFGRNLLRGIGAGFERFFDRIGTHLLNGLLEWLFSGLGDVGVKVPKDFSLKSVITFFLEVMGISWARIRKLLAKHVGEENVALIEKAYGVVAALIQQGPEGIFELLKEQLNPKSILDMVLDAAIDYITTALIKQVTVRVLALFNPAGAALQALEAIYKVLKWVFENAAKLFKFVETVVNGISDVLQGNIGGMAKAVEAALASLIAPVIDFLAGYVGLGDLPEQIAKLIKGLQEWVEGILDKVIGWLVAQGKKLLAAVGIGKKEEQPKTDDPEHDAKVATGLAAIDEEEKKYLENGKISREEAGKVAATVKRDHKVFRSITIVDAGERWDYHYVGSEGTKKGEPQEIQIADTRILVFKAPGASIRIVLPETDDEVVIKERANKAKKLEVLVQDLGLDENMARALINRLPGSDLDGLLLQFAREKGPHSPEGILPPEAFLIDALRKQRATSAAVATPPGREARSKLVHLGEGKEPLSSLALVFRPFATGQFEGRYNPEAKMWEFIFHGTGRPEVATYGVIEINDFGQVARIVQVSEHVKGGEAQLIKLMTAAGWKINL